MAQEHTVSGRAPSSHCTCAAFSSHPSVLGNGTGGQRLVQHFHVRVLRKVVKATQVTNETLQLLQELKRQEKPQGEGMGGRNTTRCDTEQPTDTSRKPWIRASRLTSVLPFLTSSKRSSTSARLGSSESTNHMGGVDGYDSCNTSEGRGLKKGGAWALVGEFVQNGTETYKRAPGTSAASAF